ncbi:pilin [Nonomuraea sp. MG754425]|uniref:pilin n=1 Tax=Nonomuraea sp. MG754425 TaxID=2570319 RepID=UPI001F3F7721|nr:pilin [Nonomuraea sp. MG754425]
MIPRTRSTTRKALLITTVVLGAVTFGTLLELALAHLAQATATPTATADSVFSTVTTLAAEEGGKGAGSLNKVIDNLRNVIIGLLVALATLFLTVGGVRYILAGGDPGEVESAKKTLRYAALGYGIAVLAPLLVSVLKGIVGA